MLAPDNLFLLYVGAAVTKALHELGHGLACKHFGRRSHTGGEVHTMGIMMLALIPMPYVDASSSWALRNKWHRAFVAAAGMYFELALAAVAAIVWARAAEGTTVYALAYNIMFVSGVSTILFNANPLIRFDGYFILSDLFELPNLAQRSRDMLYHLVKKCAFGVRRSIDPARTVGERPWLLIYAIASLIYRVVLCVTILLFIADKLFFLGALLAMSAVIAWVVVPVGKFVRYLGTSAELSRVRARAVGVTVATVGALLGALLWVPAPSGGRAEGVVQALPKSSVHAPSNGYVVRAAAPTGRAADADDVLVELSNPDLQAELRQALAQRSIYIVQYNRAVTEELAEAQSLLAKRRAIEQKIDRLRKESKKLTVRAPFAGVWTSETLDGVEGVYVFRGRELGTLVGQNRQLTVTADQFLGPRIESEIGVGGAVELMVKGRPDARARGRVVSVLPAGRSELPSEALGHSGGGRIAVEPTQQGGYRAVEPYFDVKIELIDDEAQASLRPGQVVIVRFALPDAPLMVQAWRMVRQTIQKRFQI